MIFLKIIIIIAPAVIPQTVITNKRGGYLKQYICEAVTLPIEASWENI